MVDRINHNVDHMSMAHSIEARPVFLDHALWEFCAAVPPKMKLRGSILNQTEKHLLREAARGVIPEEVRMRKKKGLSVPARAVACPAHVCRSGRRQRCPRAELDRAVLFDPDAVAQLRREHQRGAPARASLLMGVLSIQVWRSLFIASPRLPS